MRRAVITLSILAFASYMGCGPRGSNTGAECGNGILEGTEECDDGEMNSDTRPGACRTDCTLFICGDGVMDPGEACDGSDLGGMTCASVGLFGGILGCFGNCTLDTTGCSSCGNGVAEGTIPTEAGYEECDGDDLRGETCVSRGFAWGTLGCVNCRFDTSGCRAEPAVCGDGLIEDTEECDGDNLGGRTCMSLGEGFTGGFLACDDQCLLDRSSCATCGNGIIEPGEVCDDGNTIDDFTCSADCTMACGPGAAECNGDVSTYCLSDGSGILTEYCDPLQGMTCDPAAGRCDGLCASMLLGNSYVGCDYYPTVTSNPLLNSKDIFTFSVAVANTSSLPANVTVTRGANTVASVTVASNGIQIINLPWISALDASQSTSLVANGAYRLRSDMPVTVYQYNPLQYTQSGQYTYTNDASLLLPVNTWTGNYRVVARNTWSGYPGFYAVTASEDNTTVTLMPSATGGLVVAGAGVTDTGTGVVTLNHGDVLQVFSRSGGGAPDVSDLTGTLVEANKPVQVIGGHVCTNVPDNVTWCDHLEESMFPLETLGDDYLVTTSAISPTTTKAILVRVVATEPGTTLVYDPPVAGAPSSIAAAGQYIEIGPVNIDFQITSNHPIMVVQYMQGQAAGGGTGDPAMAMVVPARQYRTNYLFHAPTNYEANYVNITALLGSTIVLNGVAITDFTPIGNSGYGATRVQLSNAGNGNHNAESAAPFGISVYGYGQYTSYWYPGGLNLLRDSGS